MKSIVVALIALPLLQTHLLSFKHQYSSCLCASLPQEVEMGNCNSGGRAANIRSSRPHPQELPNTTKTSADAADLHADGYHPPGSSSTPLISMFLETSHHGDAMGPNSPVTGPGAASMSFTYPDSPNLGPRNDTTAFSNGSFAVVMTGRDLLNSDVLRSFQQQNQFGTPCSRGPVPSAVPESRSPTPAPTPAVQSAERAAGSGGPSCSDGPLVLSATLERIDSRGALSVREQSSIQTVRSWLMTTSSTEESMDAEGHVDSPHMPVGQ